jgi:hypothetical protein
VSRQGTVMAGNQRYGRLWRVAADAFRGEWVDRRGKLHTKEFRGVTGPEARFQWRYWQEQMDGRQAADMRLAAHRQAEREDAREAAARATQDTTKEADMPSKETKAPSGAVYVVTVVGGAPIRYAADQDTALAVATALEAAAKASGFAAKYDVVEVQPWM